MRPVHYHLEIYEPAATDTVKLMYVGQSPFMAISAGDLINSVEDPRVRLKVSRVEHIFWEAGDHVAHKLCIYTEEMQATPQLFHPPSSRTEQ